MEDNKILISNSDSQDFELEILFSFKCDNNDNHYLLACDDDYNVFVFKVDDDKQELEVVEDENILNLAQELLDEYQEEKDEKTIS